MDIQSYGRGFKSARNVDIFTILYTSKLKAPGSNPLNNRIKVPGGDILLQYDSLPWLLYLSSLCSINVQRFKTRIICKLKCLMVRSLINCKSVY